MFLPQGTQRNTEEYRIYGLFMHFPLRTLASSAVKKIVNGGEHLRQTFRRPLQCLQSFAQGITSNSRPGFDSLYSL
jgi:hypothetical protein